MVKKNSVGIAKSWLPTRASQSQPELRHETAHCHHRTANELSCFIFMRLLSMLRSTGL